MIQSNTQDDNQQWAQHIILILRSKDNTIQSLIDSQKVIKLIGAQKYEKRVVDLLEICDQLGVKKNTKFASRYLLDLVLLQLEDLEQIQKEKIEMACVMIAFGMNSQEKQNKMLNYVEVFEYWKQEHNLSDMLVKIQKIVDENKGKLNDAVKQSPYDYANIVLSNLQLSQQNMEGLKEGVDMMIDLAISNPEAGKYSSEEIYKASWMAFAETKIQNECDKKLNIAEKYDEMRRYLVDLISE